MPNAFRVFDASDYDLPYGSFSSSGTQSISTGSSIITYTDIEASRRVSLSGTSQIFIEETGMYLLTYSAVGKSSAPNVVLDVWLMVNGADVPRSNTVSRFVGSANERIITVTYLYPFTKGQYFQLKMRSDTAGTSITATSEDATHPACPSIIVTANKVGI